MESLALKMKEKSRRYIVVTACKNEEENLPNLIESMVSQTIISVLWVIVDDGSTDKTPEIIKEAGEKYNWIQSIRFGIDSRDIGLHLSSVLKKGFDFAIKFCMKNGIDYGYLSNIDGDIILEPAFFENLITEFEKDSKLGIASGGAKLIVGERIVHAKVRVDEPSGGHMLIRKRCFEECRGIQMSSTWDAALRTNAKLRGWKTRRFEENIVAHIGDVIGGDGYWKGYLEHGRRAYRFNIHPIHVIIKSIKYLFEKPYYIGIAYLIGYFKDFILRKEQTEDEEIKEYFWNKWKKIVGDKK